jgi:polygalacturonase
MLSNARMMNFLIIFYGLFSLLISFVLGYNIEIPQTASGFINSTIYNVVDYGAIPDNQTLNTIPITKAIQEASISGGGIVYFPPGVYFTGGFNLSSNVYLYIASGATIQASANYDDYSYDWDFWDVIHAENVSNCGIIGEGINSVISGPMWQMIESYDEIQDAYQPVIWTNIRGCQGECRPRGIVFVDAINITIYNFWLCDSADWSSLYRRVSHVWISDLIISGSLHWPNNDGIDLESGYNITIQYLNISTGDDGIVFVSGNTNTLHSPWPEEISSYTPLHHVIIQYCEIQSKSGALKFEAIFQQEHGDIYDIIIQHNMIRKSNRGLGFQQRTGSGNIYNVLFHNIT